MSYDFRGTFGAHINRPLLPTTSRAAPRYRSNAMKVPTESPYFSDDHLVPVTSNANYLTLPQKLPLSPSTSMNIPLISSALKDAFKPLPVVPTKEDSFYSKKVFIGRVPHAVTQNTDFGKAMECIFRRFGEVEIQWPRPATHFAKNSACRLTGYLFLLFKNPISVQKLKNKCITIGGELYLDLGRALDSIKIHVRPWDLKNSVYCISDDIPLNPRKNTVFLGRLPRVCTATQVASIMEQNFGTVLCVEIDVDPAFKYPQGSAAVYFAGFHSYIKAIGHHEIDMEPITGRAWTTEIKPYVSFGCFCEECGFEKATSFCPNLNCLQYYCVNCWDAMHRNETTTDHMPYVEVSSRGAKHRHVKSMSDTTVESSGSYG